MSTTDVNLTIEGSIRVLRLRPGDVIVASFPDHNRVPSEALGQIRDALKEKFPAHDVLLMGGGIELEVARRPGGKS